MIAGAVFFFFFACYAGAERDVFRNAELWTKFRGLALTINANRVKCCIYCLNNVRNLEHKFSDFNEILVDEFASACYVYLSKSELFNRVNRCKPRAYSKKKHSLEGGIE